MQILLRLSKCSLGLQKLNPNFQLTYQSLSCHPYFLLRKPASSSTIEVSWQPRPSHRFLDQGFAPDFLLGIQNWNTMKLNSEIGTLRA